MTDGMGECIAMMQDIGKRAIDTARTEYSLEQIHIMRFEMRNIEMRRKMKSRRLADVGEIQLV